MLRLLVPCWNYIRAFVVIYLCLWSGNYLANFLPISIPGSIIGMLLLFTLLALQILPANWVQPGCHLLIRYMALLFVPIGVGIMSYYDLLVSQFGPIIISCLLSTLITMLVMALSAQLLYDRQGKLTTREEK